MTRSKSFSRDTESLEAIILAFYEIVSGPAGTPRQWERDKWIHAPDARILFPTGDADRPGFTTLTLEEYHERGNRHEQSGFFEEEISRKTERFGHMAHVWSTYRWKKAPDGPWEGRGINSIQLYYSEKRWWISSWVFFSEDDEHFIPSDYLI